MIEHQVFIEAPAAIVFELFVDGDGLCEWMCTRAEVDRRPGGAFRWEYANGDVVEGELLALDPPRRLELSYGWQTPASRGILPGSTRVQVELVEDERGTTVTLRHLSLPAATEQEHLGGWKHFGDRLVHAAQARAARSPRPSRHES